ncbi:TonB-dependent receptor [Dasania sp. GY-MA-18]|uniref:TonB-dependent receptor n=1 Tax=Dasania phycosphaerae TaxID=2950436 RepID=A0A9J6RN30_9GAMM|nr:MULTISPECIES: TonB-dependent receptor [Dasania]MCR8922974.1 TonB-dependent receptor [Dasania sp. GY-MA-18]MCZ0865405.1 TonB-dependent receptor [Dasania phycosphaerae]MCZ0869130.1 TonB-dependent receptor [Dasania phycosphaerae]
MDKAVAGKPLASYACALLWLCCAFFSSSVMADALVNAIDTSPAKPKASIKSFNLPAQSLATALLAFSKQAGVQLILPQAAMPEHSTVTYEGDYPPLQLLAQLLEGSGLSYELSGEHTVVIQAIAQPSTEQMAQPIEEILVTARKRRQRPEQVSVALSVFDGGAITNLGIANPERLAAQVPSMTVKSPYATSNPVFTIRGIGYNSFTSNMSSTIGFYVDDLYLNSSSLLSFDLYDIERVEVLRGPQGTLFGRNTLGGAIGVVTRKPRQTFDGYLRVDKGNYQYTALQGAVGGGLTEQLAGRFSFNSRRQQQGFYENSLNGRNHGEVDINSWRASLLWAPDEKLSVYAKVYALKDRSEQWHYDVLGTRDPNQPSQSPLLGEVYEQPCQAWLQDDLAGLQQSCVNIKGYQDTDGDPYKGRFSLDPIVESDTRGGVLQVNWQLPFAELQSITGYQDFEKLLEEEFDASPLLLGDNILNDDIGIYSQELRLVSQSDSAFEWIVGAIYSDEDIAASVLTSGRDRWGTDILVDYRQKTINQALFSHVEWSLNSRWRALAGLRYSHDQIDFKGTTQNLDPYNNGTVEVLTVPVAPGVVTATDNSISYGSWSGKLGLDYQASDHWLWYGNISQAYKSGGFTGYWVILPEDGEPYDEETLTAYELGLKWQLPAWHMVASAALYYYDYRDLQQVSSTAAGTFLISNAGDIRSRGLEGELNWQPSSRVNMVLGASYIDATYYDTQNSELQQADTRGEGLQDLTGNVPVNTPEWAMNIALDYRLPLDHGLSLTFSTDAAYQSKVYLALDNLEVKSQEAYWIYNGSIVLAGPEEHWQLSLWGRNLADKTYHTEAFSSKSSGLLMRVVAPPRSYGVALSYQW